MAGGSRRQEGLDARGGGNSLGAVRQANMDLKATGQAGQYTGGGYRVLGGPGTAQALSMKNALSGLGIGGGGTPTSAGDYLAARGVGGVPAGGVGMPSFSGSVGAGSGPGAGNAQTTMQTQTNPYLKQLMDLSLGQFSKPLDREAELSKLRREQSQRMNEARQSAGAGGRGGMWGAQQQQLANEQGQQLAGTIAGFSDRETEARRALLGTMSGIAGEGLRDIATQLQAQQQSLELQERSRQANMDYATKMALLPYQAMQMKLQGLNSILGLL